MFVMAKLNSSANCDVLNVDFMRSLVKQYSELGQWTSALFWADAAAATGGREGVGSGDDMWLLASAMLARGELHRAAHTVTSRGLHRQHLLCLGVATRAFLAAQEPESALNLIEECDSGLLESRANDQTHNRALGGILVTRARALSALDRRDAAAEALTAALRADVACYEALDLLLDQHALTAVQESALVESLPYSSLSEAEAKFIKTAYKDRLRRYLPSPSESEDEQLQIVNNVESVRQQTAEARCARARRLAATCEWTAALKELNTVDPWCCAEVRTACLVELRRYSELFAFAHTLVDGYPNSWTAWFAVGCYYYLIGKNELARRYLSKSKSLEPSAGCVWLAYGHSFAADNEHDQAMAAYFKASQLMGGCHVPVLYVGVECALLNNTPMAERFLARAAELHAKPDAQNEAYELELLSTPEPTGAAAPGAAAEGAGSGWSRIARAAADAQVAHEAGAAAFACREYAAAEALWARALAIAADTAQPHGQVGPRWAPTLDALGHACRKLGRPSEALTWHEKALACRPGRASTYTAIGLCLALLGRASEAADALHTALAKDPDDAVALGLLDAIVAKLDAALTDEETPQFPFPSVALELPATGTALPSVANPAVTSDVTNTSDMSMSFD